MSEITLVLASPHRGGVTDRLGQMFAEGAEKSGASVNRIALRDFCLHACDACGACGQPPFRCRHENDDAARVFSLCLSSGLVVFSSPIYFYHLPALFKSFIDRAQSFWAAAREHEPAGRPGTALAIMAAARNRGEKLFAGSLLTLDYFCKALNMEIRGEKLYRGLESPASLAARPEISRELEAFGFEWGKRISGGMP